MNIYLNTTSAVLKQLITNPLFRTAWVSGLFRFLLQLSLESFLENRVKSWDEDQSKKSRSGQATDDGNCERGRDLSPPIPMAIGIKPNTVARDVINIGRSLVLPPVMTASCSSIPFFLNLLI